MKFGAYIDSYYTYDFNRPANNQRPYVTQYDRHNEFNINHAWLKGAYDSEKIRASVALQLGTYPANNYGAEPTWAQMIYEGFAGYKITKKGWLDIGIFGGHFGYESALSIDRELLSPALATEYTPYYQSGVRYTHYFSDRTQLRAVILNGWQNIRETNNFKSVGMAIDHQVNDVLFVSYGNYYGKDRSPLLDNVWRFHNNAIINLTPSENISLTGIVDWTLQDSPSEPDNYHTTFFTLIAHYDFTDQWGVGGRFEQVTDENEILISSPRQGVNQTVLSLSVSYCPAPNVAFKLEPKFYSQPTLSSFAEKSPLIFQGGLAVRLE